MKYLNEIVIYCVRKSISSYKIVSECMHVFDFSLARPNYYNHILKMDFTLPRKYQSHLFRKMQSIFVFFSNYFTICDLLWNYFFKDIGFCYISSYSYHNFPMVLMFGNFRVTLYKIARKYASIEIKYSDYLFCAAATGMNMVVWMGKYYVTEQLQWKNDENNLKESQKKCIYGMKYITNSDWWSVIWFECKTIGWHVWCKW